LPNDLLKADASYIIIGGTGGLGRSIARWMVEKGARNIILLSRSGAANGKIDAFVEEMKGMGGAIVVRRCDVAKKDEVEELISNGWVGMPPVRGVIHGAMVLHVSCHSYIQ
jgi:NAD(P)-dependent dehydrogenase (short-subunit alcohol dehydrogenase family)